MAEPVNVDEVVEAMYQLVVETTGSRKLRPTDVTRAMIERFGADRCNRDLCKQALKKLTESERCVYTFYDGSYIELPSKANQGGQQ
ncbi:MAG TPA: hypothetical protein VMG58_13765 [Candidatus Sulfotelmatobacter sp.]|nr:hypothetical protein [Candidatus Sulfotelmatobacter sp.]